ncbi:SGNH/GDSL hydrolase family protein [Symbioplanes lichenis]|uniref:SGNH/GDSL hydrolase family protein n=1 Tax=Symbioplanes lichenis TaxID=1629072 RepID=UPI00273A45C3|nr:SGNH/GDSL hydrolase family protein [Actinoplanes lichenis]
MGTRARKLGIAAMTAVLGAGLVAGVNASLPAAASSLPAVASFVPTKVMPLGDSITRGVGSPTMSSYRPGLEQRLIRGGLEINYVGSQSDGTGGDNQHEGHGGWTIDELSARLDGWLATYEPDVVLVHAGTNNIRLGEGPYTTARKLSGLLDQIRRARPGAQIFVAQIATSRVPREASDDRSYNRLIPTIVAQKQDGNMTVVDQSSVTGIDLHDLRHPNDFGYAKMAWNWYRAMSRVYGLSGFTGPNPYLATRARRCLAAKVLVRGVPHHRTECRDWTLRTTIVRTNGVERRVRIWQTLREDKQTYRVRAAGGWMTRTRVVRRWTGPGNLLNV